MRRTVFKSKLHRATVTQADVDYEGSVTLDEDLLDAADIIEYEAVHIWNVTQGTRLQTYALRGERGSGVCCVNGAAAHLCNPGDLVIVATFTEMEDAEARLHKPTVVLLGPGNRILDAHATEIPGPKKRSVYA